MLALNNLKMCVQPIVKPLPAYLSPKHKGLTINMALFCEIDAATQPEQRLPAPAMKPLGLRGDLERHNAEAG